ncbi:hypothetical protein DNL40_04850 [Xylanimonas oleitrophica]|uniref:Uncharacterized protein n=2 Tax=Xylanimonas oleitrophica TaxID=2607479 RepID=A0A2W5WU96_9MICO|nr:hypothetical protein DNL40_04850 [Xylanimonas oleitrophica]
MRLDQSLVTPLSDADQAGLYAVAVAVGELPLLLSAAVRDVTFVSEAAGSDDARLARTSRVATLVCGAVALGVGLTMGWWLPLLFGAAFAPAVPVTAVVLAAVVLGIPGSVAGSALGGRGRPGLRSVSLAVACAVNLVVLLLLVPSTGALGAAWATLVGNAVAAGMNLVFARAVLGTAVLPFLGLRRGDVGVLVAAGRRMLGGARRRR